MIVFRKFPLFNEAGGDAGSATGGGAASAPSPAPAAEPSSAPSPVPSPAPSPTASPAPSPAPSGGTAAPSPAPSPAPEEGYWKGDWRERMAGGDDKALKQLSRYASPEEIWKKARSLEQKMSSGELKPVLGKNASTEELSEWRKAHGIPESADKYDITGISLDEGDKGLVAEVLKAAHGAHLTPEQAKAIVGIWPSIKEAANQRVAEQDHEFKQKAEDELRGEWGNDFRRNLNLIHQLMDSTGDAKTKDLVLNGRLADGTPFGSSPAALRMLLGVALQANPTATLLPVGTANAGKSIDDEIASIEKAMRADRQAYNKDEKMQARFRELLIAKEKLNQRAA